MGARANLIIIQDSSYEIFYCHWCAYGIPRDLFWGPEVAASFIRMQLQTDEMGWLDDRWAEGGALLDLDKQVLLLFGGESLSTDVPFRRVYMELLRAVWEGWQVRWAYEGLADLADYVGYPRSEVIPDWYNENDLRDELESPEVSHDISSAATVILEDGRLRLYPLWGSFAPDYLMAGASLIEHARSSPGVNTLFPDELGLPCSGFHIDVTEKKVEFWLAYPQAGVREFVARYWPGWQVIWHLDRFEFQMERARGRLRFPRRSRSEELEALKNYLMWEPTHNPAEDFLNWVEEDVASGSERGWVNPLASRHDPLLLPADFRQKVLERALSIVKGGATDD